MASTFVFGMNLNMLSVRNFVSSEIFFLLLMLTNSGDMNTYCVHLMHYLLAKILFALERKEPIDTSSEGVDGVLTDGLSASERSYLLWNVLLDRFGMGSCCESRHAAVGMLQVAYRSREPLSSSEGDALRQWFGAVGKEARELIHD